MRNRKIFGFFIFIVFIGLAYFTYAISNIWLMISDQGNYVPKESNIFSFHPIKIDDGSGGYWRYGEDKKNYYYFSENKENIYYIFYKNIKCPKFNEIEFSTWCQSTKAYK